MFIIHLDYYVPLEVIDQHLEEHIAFLEEEFKQGHFLASGRRVPRTGGTILSNIPTKAALLEILEKDPFKQKGMARYQITEFIPSKTCKELDFLKAT